VARIVLPSPRATATIGSTGSVHTAWTASASTFPVLGSYASTRSPTWYPHAGVFSGGPRAL